VRRRPKKFDAGWKVKDERGVFVCVKILGHD
jgi:hypothetical protein